MVGVLEVHYVRMGLGQSSDFMVVISKIWIIAVVYLDISLISLLIKILVLSHDSGMIEPIVNACSLHQVGVYLYLLIYFFLHIFISFPRIAEHPIVSAQFKGEIGICAFWEVNIRQTWKQVVHYLHFSLQ